RDERWPGASSWESLEHLGPLARSAADAALAMSALAGPAVQDRHSLPRDIVDWHLPPIDRRRVRIAFSSGMGFAPVDSEVFAIAQAAVSNLERRLDISIRCAQPSIANPQPYFEALVALDTDREGLRKMAVQRRIGFGA